MAQYDINFSTNASQIAKELGTVQSELAKVVRVLKPSGFSIKLDLNTADFTREIKSSFKELDQLISQIEKKLRSAKIGSPEFRLAAEQSGQLRGESQRGQMMARAISSRESAKAFDVGSLARYERVLEGLRVQASLIAPNTQEWVNFQKSIGEITLELKQADKAAESIQLTQQLGALAPGSLSRLETQLTILKNRAREIKPNTDEWKRLNKEIQNVETSIQKVTKKPLSAGQRAGAAGGAFLYGGGMGGGVGSALGGVAGGLAGGVPGAFAGAAIGQVVDNLGQSLAAITSQASKVQQLQRGLALASIDAKDFAQAQAAVADVSARLFIPLEQVTKSFSQLRVNTKQYGLSVEETKQILEGTILAVSAFGGSADDVDGAMRAVVQILSKGSVQAEELRGQLGERFPGAVIKFAQANKLSFDELQSRLKEGTIGIKEFVTFAKDNYEDYAEFSKTIATAPEFAGRRLAKALEEMQMAIGQVFGSSGATIQDFASQALKDITIFVTNNKELLAQLGQDFAVVFSGIMSVVAEAGKFVIKVLAPVFSYIGGVIRQLRVMTGAADAATAKAEMNAANVIIQRTGMGRDAFLSGQPRPGSVADKIEFDKAQERYKRAEKRFKDAGGKAALPPETGTPPNLVFGGPGAGVDMTAGADKAAKEKAAKQQSLEGYHSLQDQLAKNFTQDQLDRMEQEYQARVNRINSEFDLREARANSFQKEAIRFERQMSDIGLKRQKALLDASAEVIRSQGSVAGGAMAGGSAAGAYLQGNIGPTSTGPHFDVKKMGGGYFPRNYLDQYVQVNGRPLSSGTTVPGGTFAGHQRRGSHGWDYAFGEGRHAATLMGGAKWMEGSPTAHGEARKFQLPTGEMFQFLHGRSEGIGMGAPRKVSGDEKRDVIADQKTQLAIAQKSLTVRLAEAQAIRDAAVAWAQYTAAIVPIEEQTLQNDILAKKNELVKASMPDDIIEKEMKYFEAQQKTTLAKAANDKLLKDGLIDEKQHAKNLLELQTRLAGYNTELDRNIQLQRQQKFDASLQQLKDQVAALRIIGDEERRLFELRKEYGSDEKAQQIFDLEKIKKNIEDTRALIDSFVSQTSSDYKGFLKAVISGEDAVDALKKFQEGLKDRVLTIFLDFAMAPVEKFLKESLEGLFLPKAPKELKPEEEKEKTGIEGNTVATDNNTTAINNLTSALQGAGAASPTSAAFGGGGGGIFDAANVFGGGGNLTGGIFDTISQQMGGATESLSSFSSHMSQFIDTSMASADAVGSWGDSFNTKLSDSLTKATDTTNQQGATFKESLGKAVGAIGVAAGAIMGIAAGISQIKKGGTSNVLGGIGSILLSVGGAIGGFTNLFKAANGAVWKGGFQAFANGGTVTGPTLGLVGEGKYNEAIVPLPDGRSIPVQMRGGSSRDLLNAPGSASAAPTMLSMSFQSTTINGVEYVDRAQLEAAMAETRKSATRDGASRGALLALDKLQNSPSARRRVGIR